MGSDADEARLLAAVEHDVRATLRALQGSAVEELRWERGNVRIALRRAWQPAPATAAQLPEEAVSTAAAAPEGPPQVEVRAQTVGIFHRAREPEGFLLASQEDSVESGRALGVIETLGMANDVEAPCGGRLTGLLVEDGQPVEYGELLAIIEPA